MKSLTVARIMVALYLSGQQYPLMAAEIPGGLAVATAAASTDTELQARADRYAALLEKAEMVAKLRSQAPAMPQAARPLVSAQPLPPKPPVAGKLPVPDELEKWNKRYNQDVSKEAAKEQGKGLFLLLGAACKGAAAGVGAPMAGGLCDLLLPILDALGLSLGKGDDVHEAAQALLATQAGDYGPLKEYLAKNPRVRNGVGRLIGHLGEIDPKARERLLGIDPRGATCNQLAAIYAQQGADARFILLAAIGDPTLRNQVEKGCPAGRS